MGNEREIYMGTGCACILWILRMRINSYMCSDVEDGGRRFVGTRSEDSFRKRDREHADDDAMNDDTPSPMQHQSLHGRTSTYHENEYSSASKSDGVFLTFLARGLSIALYKEPARK